MKSEFDIPEVTRAQLGVGVRGKHFKKYTQSSNVVVLRPDLHKAFPTSEAVNKALSYVLELAALAPARYRQSKALEA